MHMSLFDNSNELEYGCVELQSTTNEIDEDNAESVAIAFDRLRAMGWTSVDPVEIKPNKTYMFD
jgi:hypothetical protein